MKILSFLSLSAALLAVIFNIQSGWSMSQNVHHSSDLHLLIAILSLVTTWIGGGLILVLATQDFEDLRLKITQGARDKTELQRRRTEKDRCTQLAMGAMALSLISLISGTISHGGRFPWLHGLLGFSLAFCLLLTLFYWVSFTKLKA